MTDPSSLSHVGAVDREGASRFLRDNFAPWVLDLGLVIEAFETAAPAGAVADWQPGAILRMPFSERLCRVGGILSGQALMALADTAAVFALAAAMGQFRPIASTRCLSRSK